MLDNLDTKKYAADKIALLGLLVISLLIASLIVRLKSKIEFSEPIILKRTGLAIPLPTGNRWRSSNKWKFRKNTITLRTSYFSNSRNPIIDTYCIYNLAAEKQSTDDIFNKKALSLAGSVARTGKTHSGNLDISWAHILTQHPFPLFFATITLPENRRLDIEVYYVKRPELAEQLLQSIINKIKFEDNQLLKTGSEFVTDIKKTGIGSLVQNQNYQNYFLIKDAANDTIGFSMDLLTAADTNILLNIQVESLVYRDNYEQQTSFESDDKFENFTWKSKTTWESETANLAGTSDSVITFNDELMIVGNFDPNAKKQHYQPGPAAIPDVFFDLILTKLIDFHYEKIFIDIIEAEGKITPILISKMPQSSNENSRYVLKIESMDEKQSYQLAYLNDKKQIIKRVLLYEGFTLEATTVENILKLVPESTEYILKQNETEN